MPVGAPVTGEVLDNRTAITHGLHGMRSADVTVAVAPLPNKPQGTLIGHLNADVAAPSVKIGFLLVSP